MLRTLTARCSGLALLAVLAAGLVPAPAAAQTPVVRFQVERFVVEGDNPLPESQTRAVLAPFTGEHAGVDGLLAAADALERAIEEAGGPLSARGAAAPVPAGRRGRSAGDGVRGRAGRGPRRAAPLRGERTTQRAAPPGGRDARHRRDRPRPGGGESPALEERHPHLPGERDGGERPGGGAGGGGPPSPLLLESAWTTPAAPPPDRCAGRWGRASAISSTSTTP